MRKNKGFTLIELIVAMGLLVFIFLLSSALFDRAIQGTPKLRETITKNSETLSKMEEGIVDVKEAYRYNQTAVKDPKKKPKNYDKIVGKNPTTGAKENGAPLTVNVSSIFNITPPGGGDEISVNTLKGYFVSMDSNTNAIVYNDPKVTDRAFTFISTGYKESPTASIDTIYINSNNRFFYLPKIQTSGMAPSSLRVDYTIKQDVTMSNLQVSRLRFLISPLEFNNNIYSSFHDGYNENKFFFVVTPDLFGFIGTEQDSTSKQGASVNYTIPSYSSDKEEYLKIIDRDFAAEATTFNLNGRTGSKNSTFGNQDISKQNAVHFIGLPYTKYLDVHMDPNLVISQSRSDRNKYYSLFDMANKDATSYGDVMKENGTRYDFSWGNNDIRNFLDLGARKSDSINVPNAFMEEVIVQNSDGIDKKIPDVTKPYGNTMYYSMKDDTNSITFPSGKTGSKQVYIKFNTRNYYDRYGNSEKFPYALLSYNYDYNTGDIVGGQNQGFLLYVDSDGKIKSALFNRSGNPIITDIGNIADTKLYTDEKGKYEFDSLNYDHKINSKRDERQDFNIMNIDIRGNNVSVYMLYRKSEDTLQTEVRKIFETNISDMSKRFKFGHSVKLLKNPTTGVIDTMLNSNVEPVIEIADILVYYAAYDGKSMRNIMDYLYRRYLTVNERTNGKFDEWYLNEY